MISQPLPKARRPHLTPLRWLLLLGLSIGVAAVSVGVLLCSEVLIPFASACVQACARDPFLMTIARGTAALALAAIASGTVVGGVVLAKQLWATRRLVRQVEMGSVTPPPEVASAASGLGFADRLTYVLDPDAYAFCYGFLSPRICISSGMADSLSSEELRAVLLHERFHLRQRDPLKVLASRIAAAVLFMMPMAAQLRDRYLVDKELEADAHVVEQVPVQALAGALLKLYRKPISPSLGELAAAAVGPFSPMSARIQQLAGQPGKERRLSLARLAASLAAAVVLVSLTVASAFAAERSAPVGKTCCGQSVYCNTVAGGQVQ